MKIFKLSFLLILGISVLSSCAKKNNPTPIASSNPFMTAKVNGVDWTASSVLATKVNSNLLSITGYANNVPIDIEMPPNLQAGTDSVSLNEYSIVISYSTSYLMTKGVLVITSNANNTVSGTFSGTLTDQTNGSGSTVVITNGAFTAKYQ